MWMMDLLLRHFETHIATINNDLTHYVLSSNFHQEKGRIDCFEGISSFHGSTKDIDEWFKGRRH